VCPGSVWFGGILIRPRRVIGRLELRRTLRTAKTFTRNLVFGRTLGIVCLGLRFGRCSLGQPFFD
jgi:hypothetical protein